MLRHVVAAVGAAAVRRGRGAAAARRLATAGAAEAVLPPHDFYDAAKLSPEADEALRSTPRDADEADVVIVGAGPAGLAAAIRIKQRRDDLRVVVLEKAAEVGLHTLSGACIEVTALDELFDDPSLGGGGGGGGGWRDDPDMPLTTEVSEEHIYYALNADTWLPAPEPPAMRNAPGNRVGSLGLLVRWLGARAEALGVEVFSGFAAQELVYNEARDALLGVATHDVGVARDGSLRADFARGMELRAPLTLLAEGCRGSLTTAAERHFALRDAHQTYGIGLKEVWQVPAERHRRGAVLHSFGWPAPNDTWGGAFLYHYDGADGAPLVALGYVVGLDYPNPYLNPYRTFQQWKTHKNVAALLDGGECIAYGARALNEGGFQSLPRLAFPGGALLGCAAGMLNVPKVKGSHNAIRSGIMAAEAACEALPAAAAADGDGGRAAAAPVTLDGYQRRFDASEVYRELHEVRNVRPSFTSPLGAAGGAVYTAVDSWLLRGKAPWTLRHRHKDHEARKPAAECKPIDYPPPDGKLTFDLLSNLARTGTNHEEDQPAHLRLADAALPVERNLAQYAGPEARFCPAGVYEFVDGDDGPELVINAQNCIHCKTCTIADDNIRWTTPMGGGGPAYQAM